MPATARAEDGHRAKAVAGPDAALLLIAGEAPALILLDCPRDGSGLALLCQDEAGPYQAIPQPGASWQPETKTARQPHEYLRGGTAKLLTLFRPTTGALRAKAVTSGTNAVLHPWLIAELEQVLAGLPVVETVEAERPVLAQ